MTTIDRPMFHHQIVPRFSETDALGHINNTVLPVWFEEARADVFRLFNPSLRFETWNLILRKLEIEIERQIVHGSPVEIATGIEAIGNTSTTLLQVAEQGGHRVALCRAVLVHFDYGTQKPAPIPDAIRSELEQHRVDEASWVDRIYGVGADMWAAAGGGEAVIERERESWD